MELDIIFATASARALYFIKHTKNLSSYETRRVLFDDSFHTFIAGASLLSIFVFTLLLFCYRTPRRLLRQPTESLSTLLVVFTPTRASWPSGYAGLLPHSTGRHSKLKLIRLPISGILRNVSQGTIELRDSRSLCQLFRRDLCVYGWSIHLLVDVSWRTSVVRWLIISQMPGFTPRVEVSAAKLTKSLFERQLFAIANGSIIPPRHPGSRPGDLEDPGATIDIDFIQYSDLERTLRAVRSQLQPGCSVSIEFTAIEAHVTFLSDEFIFCAIPFLTPRPIRPSSARRTTTPLLASLHRITEYLTTGTSSTSIETITNATSERITALRLLHKNLLTDRALRSALIRNLEEQGWREYRFMVSWEAELLAAGLLSRWAIVIRK